MNEWRQGGEQPHPGADETIGGAIVRNPVVQTLFLMSLVSAATWVANFVGLSRELFVLSAPLADRPWTLVTSVYAHIGPDHLLGNAIMVLIFGGLVSISTTSLRFHLFFLISGVSAGVAQVAAYHMQDSILFLGVLGSSGAAFALMGYVLTSNILSKFVSDRLGLPRWFGAVVIVFVAAGLTMSYSAPGSALFAHFTGAMIGLVAGHSRLLHT
ncbi:rhomboid family intramembrane serine protease [Haloferax denitrificans]|uniref:Peptidase S54 rhomboid domain-containing protein n=1 Tax=Haloferax denitrificans ATCC 35960 TaxID=662478 RepID=M0J548_9EURY|nr:rhomboid family intramembrane serine protease [Haloferax denitrificans]EMA04267.1 hypothetical protein C438_13183 [Haloferax denitrificans ATCC 35960]